MKKKPTIHTIYARNTRMFNIKTSIVFEHFLVRHVNIKTTLTMLTYRIEIHFFFF